MMNVFTAENIQMFLENQSGEPDLDIVVHGTIDSTNTWALKECKAGRPLPFVCFAERQTEGKGRRGKAWVMPPESNVAMSLAWSFVLPYQSLQLLPLSIAMAIVETQEGFNLKRVQIKWPNDVYVDGVKIAGVLIETKMLKRNVDNKNTIAVVIGIGLNYDMGGIGLPGITSSKCKLVSDEDSLQKKSDMTKFAFTDICSEFKKYEPEKYGLEKCDLEKQIGVTKLAVRPERLAVASKLLRNVMRTCHAYQKDTGFALNAFRQKYDYCRNKLVDIVLDDQSVISGVAKGVTDDAELIVEIDGVREILNSAEVSVKRVKDVVND
jgi:BirA family biotin operon repressor/biotin-[acetyl-CoA-carboxylase] ligase